MIAEPWADCVQRGHHRSAVVHEEFRAAMIAEPRPLASFGVATTAELLQTTILEATDQLPQFDLMIIQTHFFMQRMLIFSVSA